MVLRLLTNARGANSLFLQPVEGLMAVQAMPYGTASYHGLDNDTGVLRFAAFANSNLQNISPLKYIADVTNFTKEAFTHFKAQGYTKVLVDVSRNTGGDIAAGYAIFRHFFPNANPYYGQDMRYSPLLKILVESTNQWRPESETPFNYHFSHRKDGGNSSSLNAFLGPVHKNNESFTPIFRANDQAYMNADMLYEVPLPTTVSIPLSLPFPFHLHLKPRLPADLERSRHLFQRKALSY